MMLLVSFVMGLISGYAITRTYDLVSAPTPDHERRVRRCCPLCGRCVTGARVLWHTDREGEMRR
jgi:hypothetical protein